MASNSDIHLFIPQLLSPLRGWKKDFQFIPKSNFLPQFLENYDVLKKAQVIGTDASLLVGLGFPENTELPIAHYYLDNNSQSNSTVLCADPVHLEVGMNDITLTEKIMQLSIEESQVLIDLLNQHFHQDGLVFSLGLNNQWILSLSNKETVVTTPLEQVLRENIAYFPIQSEQRNWKALQNEVQMLLHSAPLNQQREMLSLPTINSLWFWGGGKPMPLSDKASQVFSRDAKRGQMIAKASQCDWHDLSDLAHELPTCSGKTIILCDELVESAVYEDFEQYQLELSRLDKHVIKPLLDAWKAKKITLIINPCDGNILKPHPKPAWKFWKKKPVILSDLTL